MQLLKKLLRNIFFCKKMTENCCIACLLDHGAARGRAGAAARVAPAHAPFAGSNFELTIKKIRKFKYLK
jgi:hypothetical protein